MKRSSSTPRSRSASEVFFLKGSGAYDWGMQNRLARIFDPGSGRTVMLAFDHGYFQGPTSGLERVDVNILPLCPTSTRCSARAGSSAPSSRPPSRAPVWLRASGGPSILKDLSDEQIAVDIEDAVRINAVGVGVQVFVGGDGDEDGHEHDAPRRRGPAAGIPVLGVTAVGRELTRDARYLRLASRMIAELGAQVVKTYFCDEGFETVTASCPVPIVMAGGKKLPETRCALDGLPRDAGRAPPAWTWAATSSRATRRWRCSRRCERGPRGYDPRPCAGLVQTLRHDPGRRRPTRP